MIAAWLLVVALVSPAVTLYDWQGASVPPGGDACGLAPEGTGFTPATTVTWAVMFEGDRPLESFGVVVAADGSWRAPAVVFPPLTGPLEVNVFLGEPYPAWHDPLVEIPFVSLCAKPPPATDTLPATDTEG